MQKKPSPCILRSFLLGALALASTATLPAAVVGLWRFEGSNYNDFSRDSINNGVLAKSGTPTQTTIPTTGAGSAFPNPVPSTGAANASFATFAGDNHFAAGDIASYNVGTQMTIEFFFNATTVSSTSQTIASQYETGSNNRSWFIAVQDNQFRFATSPDGTAINIGFSAFDSGSLTGGNDYYGAAVYDAGTVTFYLKNLTTPGNLLTSTVSSGFATSLNNSTTSFRIGAFNGTGSERFTGAIDEVRFSNTALSAGNLMIVPEPSTAALACGALCLLLRRRR